jgi:Tol biopolymer transport system component
MYRLIALSLVLAGNAVADSDAIDRSGKWDIDGPLGPSGMLEFTTDEGTWMNLDVHPDGDRILFDLVGDLYIVSIDGGEASQLTSGAAMDLHPRFSPDGSQVLFSSDRGGNMNIWVADFDGSELSKIRVVTEQTSNHINGGDWMADGDWVLARRRITDTSSIGVSDLWMFHKDGGSGVAVTSNKGEVDSFSTSKDGRYIYLGTAGGFSYGRNPHGRIWSITRLDRETGETRPVTGGNGSAAAPALSPDGQSIAFVRRIGVESTLWIHNLNDGSEQQIWDGLDRDQIEGFGTNFIYPGYDWMPDGQSLVVWAGGKINRVAADGSSVDVIPFEAKVSHRFRQPLRSTQDPAPDDVQARLIRWPVFSPDGNTLAFTAFGHLYYQTLPDGTPQRVTTASELEFSPSFSPDGSKLAFTTWNDADGGSLRVANVRRGKPGASSTIYESGTQLVNPAFSADGEQILVVAGSGANLRGDNLGSEQRHDILVMNSNGRGGGINQQSRLAGSGHAPQLLQRW